MAISTTFTFDNGLTVDKAYARINSIRWQKTDVVVEIYFYASAQARKAGKPPFQSDMLLLPPSDDISVPGMYTYIKSLPKYAGAIDC